MNFERAEKQFARQIRKRIAEEKAKENDILNQPLKELRSQLMRAIAVGDMVAVGMISTIISAHLKG